MSNITYVAFKLITAISLRVFVFFAQLSKGFLLYSNLFLFSFFLLFFNIFNLKIKTDSPIGCLSTILLISKISLILV